VPNLILEQKIPYQAVLEVLTSAVNEVMHVPCFRELRGAEVLRKGNRAPTTLESLMLNNSVTACPVLSVGRIM